MFRDFRLGLRTALRSPGYSAVAVITMALAIGANTLLFSIANPLVVRPLPLGDPDSIGWVRQSNGPRGVSIGATSMADFFDLRAQTTQFSSLAARHVTAATLMGHGDAQRITVIKVTANLPTVWGLSPERGRLFLDNEDAPGADLVGVLSHRYWREAFQSDPGVLNRTFLLDGRTVTIVGVMSPKIEFGGIAEIDMWVPITLDPSGARDARILSVMGTLAPGATIASADDEMKAIAARLANAYPATNADWTMRVLDTRTSMTSSDTWVILGLMVVVVSFVLLIACASLANLVRARLVGRAQDLTVRKALGASRLQLVRPLVAESLALGLVGGVLGLMLAQAGLRGINAIAYEQFFKALEIDQYVLAFNLVLSLITPLLFSVWPAFSQSRDVGSDTLRGTRIRGSRRGRSRGRLLIVSQVAMAIALLVVSALAVQSMWNLRNTPTGLNVPTMLTFSLDLPPDRYSTAEQRVDITRRLTDAAAAVPGVTHAAAISHLPVFGREMQKPLRGTPNDGMRDSDRPWAAWYAASPQFFNAAGIPTLAGRVFSASDTADAQQVAVISRTTANRYFGDPASAMGRSMTIGTAPDVHLVTIVGVVDDTQNTRLSGVSPQVYVPLAQSPQATVSMVVATDDPSARAADMRAMIRQVDPALAISTPKPLAQIVDEETSSAKVLNGIFVGFAGLALMLAAAGLYGVISFTVGQRRQEFGVRMALGAEPRTIRSLVVLEGMRVSAVGVVLGLVMAFALANAASSVLFGVTPTDISTYAAVTAVVAGVALLAVCVPALRAMRVDPVTALRAD